MSREGTAVVLTLEGVFDASAATAVREAAFEALRSGCRRLVLDMLNVDDVDGFALSLLISLYCRGRERGQGLVLCGLNPEVREVFDNTTLSRVLPIASGLTEALAAGAR